LALAVGVLACALLPGSASAAARPTQATWAGSQIHLYPAFTAGYDGRGVTVAVLDGWIDTTHVDFQGRAKASADCTSGTCTTTVAKDTCGQNHGTHVAGTVGSSSYGVARRSSILAVRVLKTDSNGDCAGTPTAVAAGIDWAAAHGARVINLSLGPDAPTQGTSAISQAVARAANAGIVVVFSAGNASLPIAQAYGDNALVVAATNRSGALANYSQHGTGVSVAAPGGQPYLDTDGKEKCHDDGRDCITSLYPGNQYAVAAGTSMAAPHVAGLAALLLQQHRDWTRSQVVNRIEATARPLSGAGSGLIDVQKALGVRSTPKPSPTPTRVTSPKPKPKPSPTRAATHAVVTPSPITATPTPVVTTPPPSPSPTAVAPTAPTVVTEPRTTDASDEIPVPLAGIAGGLIGLVAAGLLVQLLRR
jgi:subtilisin family serine protease